VDDFGDVSDRDFLPVFAIPDAPEQLDSDGWSDSDDDFNLTGEYTGKYKMVMVPTKADPPTSGTRERMESWGRPVSPFPYSEILERSLPLSGAEEDIFGDMDARGVARAEGGQGSESVSFPATKPCSSAAAPAQLNCVPEESLDDDEEVDTDVVKVTSGDATTAARAAAILELVYLYIIAAERILTFLSA